MKPRRSIRARIRSYTPAEQARFAIAFLIVFIVGAIYVAWLIDR